MTASHEATVAVIGAGTMGTGIVITALRAGISTTLMDADQDALETGTKLVRQFLDRSVDKGKLSSQDLTSVLERLTATSNLEDVAAAPTVIEAIYEDLELKQGLFSSLDEICSTTAMLVTNTSTLSITRIAAGSSRPGRVVGMHFCNPAPLMPLVEVARGLHTSDEIHDQALLLAAAIGKRVVDVPDQPGFLVNRFLLPFENDCVRALEAGLGTAESIDTAVTLGLGHPMGPFTLLDVVGLDTHRAVSTSIFEQLHDPRFAPPPLIDRMIAAGQLGRKTGHGFYRYDEAGMFGA